jgi:predicted phosphodiesterase
MSITKKKSRPQSGKSEVVAIISDIHFDLHDVPTWNAFRKWHKKARPKKTIILGDFLDLGMISRYAIGKKNPLFVVPQIKCFVKEANELAKECGELIVVEGNHDERWAKYILGTVPFALRDTIGLTLKEQCIAQGLTKKVTWLQEDTKFKGLQCGPYLLRHGHNQARGFGGGGKHLAANHIDKSLGDNEIFGHHHRAQLHCKTARGKTAIAVANPCMTGDHDYDVDPNWQRGFTILELYGADNKFATPHLIIVQNGHFAYNGVVYDGNS